MRFKLSSAQKAYYYQAKISGKAAKKIRAHAILKWIIGWPIQIWRIPVGIFLVLKQIIIVMMGVCENFAGLPEFGIFIGAVFVVAAGISAIYTWKIFIVAIILLYFAYCIFRSIYDVRESYRICYNRDNGYADDYDEWEIKFGEPDDEFEDGKTYTYYYRSSGKKSSGPKQGYTDRRYARWNNTNGNANDNRNTGGAYYGNGSPYSEYETQSSENIFFGLTPEEAHKKYKKLLKTYHPDNLKTGDADKAQEIITMYEEYEEVIKQ